MSSQLSPRRTRQQSKLLDSAPRGGSAAAGTPLSGSSANPIDLTGPASPVQIETLPAALTPSITKLRQSDHRLLLKKQALLTQTTIDIPRGFEPHASAVSATLVFAQAEAGTAVCVSATGQLLTCSHCVAESAEEFDPAQEHWLIFASGRAARAVCTRWDPRRDLALLQIVAAQPPPRGRDTATPSFPFVVPAAAPPATKAPLVCVGHPGSEDLEAPQPGVRTNFDVLHVSEGQFRGYAKGQDLHDNSEIGALKHNAWTYWGHSGAPLLSTATGELVGLHSSWDVQTAMRRGVPLEAITEFLEG